MVGPCASTRSSILSPDGRSFLFPSMNFACMLGPWCKHASELQLLRSQNWQPCHLSLSAWLSNTTHLLGKRSRDMNASLIFNIAKKEAEHIIEPISLQKGWVAPQWQLRKTKGNGREPDSYKMVPFLGHKVQACKQNSYSGKNKTRTSGLSIPPYKMGGGWKEVHAAPTFCKEKKSLEPNHSVGFSQDPAFYSYKMVAPTLGVNFKGD